MYGGQEQQRGLGGALYAVYGTAPELREIRVLRSPGSFLAAALRKARDLMTRKPRTSGPTAS